MFRFFVFFGPYWENKNRCAIYHNYICVFRSIVLGLATKVCGKQIEDESGTLFDYLIALYPMTHIDEAFASLYLCVDLTRMCGSSIHILIISLKGLKNIIIILIQGWKYLVQAMRNSRV